MLQVLKGVKVVDFTVAVAASATVKILHDLGADVICVEPMTGHSSRKGFVRLDMIHIARATVAASST